MITSNKTINDNSVQILNLMK